MLSSGASVTWAHHAILAGYQRQEIAALAITIALAVISTRFQGYEYMEAFEPVELFIEALQEAPLTQSTSSNVR